MAAWGLQGAWHHQLFSFYEGSAGVGSELKAAVAGGGEGEGKQGRAGRHGTCSRKDSRYLAQRILIRERRDQRKELFGQVVFLKQSASPEINLKWRNETVILMIQQKVMMKYSSSGALFHHSV